MKMNMLSALLEALDSRPKLTAAVAIVIATMAWWTTVVATAWTDEVFYVDPGACLALGKGFSSNGWCAGGVSWGLSNPGVPLLLSGWFWLFGFGQYQSHTFFFFAHLAGVILIISWAARRWNLRPSEKVGLFLIGMFLHSLSGNTMYHARPDAFALLLFGWLLAFSFPERDRSVGSTISAVFFGIACVFFGLQFCGYFPLVAAGIFLWFRRRHLFYVGFGQAVGLGLGLLLLWLFYGSMGTWVDFIANRSDNLGQQFTWKKFVISKDFMVLIPALVLLAVLEVRRDRAWHGVAAKCVLGALGVIFVIPLFINKIGFYQAQYTWMVTIPVLLLILPALPRRGLGQGGWLKWTLVAMAIGSLAYRVSVVPAELRESQRRRDMVAELGRHMQPGDLVLGSMPLFYEIRSSVSRAVWTYDYRRPPKETVSRELKWALITEADAKVLMGRLPGVWEQVQSSAPGMPLPHYGAYLLLRRVDVP
jgi:hypothetical protein